jgi:hypothetical protein
MAEFAESTAATPAAPSLDSSLAPTPSVKELMEHVIDPTSDSVFDAAVIDISHKGVTETRPLSDEDWLKVERGGYVLAESTNLLKIPRRMVPMEDEGKPINPASPSFRPNRSAITWTKSVRPGTSNTGIRATARPC